MIDNADVIVSFKTYPHIDMYETGDHAGRIRLDWLAGGPRPVSQTHLDVYKRQKLR